jgi:type III secretion protein L
MADLVLLENGRIRLAPGTRIIKKASYTTLVQAQGLLDAAHRKAEEIVAAAKAAFEEEKQRGYAEGLENAQGEMAQQMTETALATERHYHELKEETISLVMAVTKKVLKNIDPQALVIAQVTKALDSFKGGQRITLKVHPTVADSLNRKLAEIAKTCPGIDGIDIQMTPDIPPQQMTLVSATGILEASMETQLAAIETAFRNTLRLPN